MKNELRKIGLTDYEARVYETLLVKGDLTGGKVSKYSEVPHGRVYDILQSLLEKGFVSVTLTKPKIFRAQKPELAVPIFLNQKIEDLNSLKKEIPKKLKKFNKTKDNELSEKIQLLGSKKSTYTTIAKLALEAKKELKHVFTFEKFSDTYLMLLKQIVKKGIKVKIIASLLNLETKKRIQEYIKNGIEVKYYPLDEIRFLIVDSDECLIDFIDPNNKWNRLAINFSHSGFSKHISAYFDDLWDKAETI